MKVQELVIALDQGSSSSRALAIDKRGQVVVRAQFPIKTYCPKPGWVEHDALDIARTQEKALDSVLAKIPKSAKVLGLGLACQRSTVVLWDRRTGKPVGRAPSWQDGRAASIAAGLQTHQAMAHEKTGLYLTPYYSAPKIRWILDDDARAKNLLERGRLMVGPVSSFLLWRLTKGEVFAVDPTMAQRMMLFNIRSLDWDPELLSLFGVPRDVLPSLCASAGPLGAVERGGRVLPVFSCVGDQQAADIYMGVEEGSSLINYGTGAFFLYNSGERQHRIPGLLTSVGWRVADDPPVFLEEGTVHAAGSSFDWLHSNLGLLKSKGDIDRLCRESKNRVMVLPAIGGLGAPRWDYTTKTAFFGLSSGTRPADIVRGVTEGLAFLIADIVTALRGGGLSPSSVRVAGGLSRVAWLVQFQADILGLELRRCKEAEATALGAATLAARAAGTDWGAFPVREDKVFKPKMSRDEAGSLLAAWGKFVAAQAALSRDLA